MEPSAAAAAPARLDLNVQLPDGAVRAAAVREQRRLLARLGYSGAAVARPVARRLTRKDVSVPQRCAAPVLTLATGSF
jgi:hypothetical protein